MENFWLILIIAGAAVGIFILGLSLTLIFKGHNIKSEIGENENMRARGIKCAAQQMREQNREYYGRDKKPGCPESDEDCTTSGCGGCAGE